MEKLEYSNSLVSIQLLTAFVKGKTLFFEFCGIAQTKNKNEKSVRKFFHRKTEVSPAGVLSAALVLVIAQFLETPQFQKQVLSLRNNSLHKPYHPAHRQQKWIPFQRREPCLTHCPRRKHSLHQIVPFRTAGLPGTVCLHLPLNALLHRSVSAGDQAGLQLFPLIRRQRRQFHGRKHPKTQLPHLLFKF